MALFLTLDVGKPLQVRLRSNHKDVEDTVATITVHAQGRGNVRLRLQGPDDVRFETDTENGSTVDPVARD